jgi:hypothetical protein
LCSITVGRIDGGSRNVHITLFLEHTKRTLHESSYTSTVIGRGIRRCKVCSTYTLGCPGLRLGFTRPSRGRIPPGPTHYRIPAPEIRVFRCIVYQCGNEGAISRKYEDLSCSLGSFRVIISHHSTLGFGGETARASLARADASTYILTHR